MAEELKRRKKKKSAKREPKTTAQEMFTKPAHQTKFPRAPDMKRGFQEIADDLFASGYDVVEEWQAVKDGLEIKDALTPQALKEAANAQEKVADRAFRLALVARVEFHAFMRETDAVYGAIRQAAIEHLELEKSQGVRTKQVTDTDALTTAAALYPDEWEEICSKREKAKALLEQLNNLAQLAKSRCYTVSNMMAPGNRQI